MKWGQNEAISSSHTSVHSSLRFINMFEISKKQVAFCEL